MGVLEERRGGGVAGDCDREETHLSVRLRFVSIPSMLFSLKMLVERFIALQPTNALFCIWKKNAHACSLEVNYFNCGLNVATMASRQLQAQTRGGLWFLRVPPR